MHAQALKDSEQYEKAYAEVNRLLVQDSTNPYYYDFRAGVNFKLGLIEEAKNDYDKAVLLAPKEAMFYQHRSGFFMSLQQPDLAMEDNDRALHLVTKDTLKYALILNRGECYRMKRDFQNAYKDFIAALTFDSTSLAALNDVANVLGEMGRSEEATGYLQKVIRLYPDDVGGYLNLAFQYTQMGEYRKALDLNNRALQVDPTAAFAYNNRGFVKYKLNDLKGAMEDVNRSLELYAANSFAYKNRALIFIALKQYHFACDDLKKALSLGFTQMYGDEVQKLLEKYCTNNN
jgi:tetratricopeptide (TPR) repeat protein